MSFSAWPSIEGFHNIRKLFRVHSNIEELTRNDVYISYRSKIKLDGTNAGVRCYTHGSIVAQSRSRDITISDDNMGFAKWVDDRKSHWPMNDMIIFGEFCGRGIMKGAAITQIDRKIFAVFAAQIIGSNQLIIEPSELTRLVGNIPDVYVLPWYNDSPLTINWTSSDEVLKDYTESINDWVNSVEENDPWVESIFGVKGIGEGLVFYPVSTPHLGLESFSQLAFKAKGEKHRVIRMPSATQVNPEVVSNIDQFVEMVLTEARLEQGANLVANAVKSAVPYDTCLIGSFLNFIKLDVEKETKDELVASGLSFQQINKALGIKARNWYLQKVKN